MNWLLVALFGYVGLQLLVGLAVTTRVKSEADYLIADRNLGPTLVVFSMFATWFGAAGAVYEQGSRVHAPIRSATPPVYSCSGRCSRYRSGG